MPIVGKPPDFSQAKVGVSFADAMEKMGETK